MPLTSSEKRAVVAVAAVVGIGVPLSIFLWRKAIFGMAVEGYPYPADEGTYRAFVP